MKIVECVPNISEGRRPEVYNAVAQSAANVPGVELLDAIDGDTWAFEALMAANKLAGPGRDAAIRQATLGAAGVPLSVAEVCPEIVGLCARAAEIGFAASISDAGVGAAMARACATGAAFNVRINLRDIDTDPQAREMLERSEKALALTRVEADRLEDEIWRRLGRS